MSNSNLGGRGFRAFAPYLFWRDMMKWRHIFHDWHWDKKVEEPQLNHGDFVEDYTITKNRYVCCWCGKYKFRGLYDDMVL